VANPEPVSRRALLPLLGTHTGRSAMTCVFRCGNACSHPVPNRSDNDYFGDVVTTSLSRRGVLKAGGIGALVMASGVLDARYAAAEPAGASTAAAARGALTFKPVPPNTIDDLIVPNGYSDGVVMRWGDPVEDGAPPFDFDHQTPEAQAKQFGYNCDYVAFMPLGRSGDRALLVVNHEYTDEFLMFRGFEGAGTIEQAKTAMMAHGMSVVEIERADNSGKWRRKRGGSRYNRRITVDTRMVFTGPAARSPLLRTSQHPRGHVVRGTLNNCAGGTTPWGTVLSGEENFDQYFVGADRAPKSLQPALDRYGFDITVRDPESSRGWHRVDSRFDLTEEPNEAHRHGWVVELDPYDPDFTPRKRTALGRLKHEGATTSLTDDGRVAVYMGDDERYDYVYKFVSSERYDGSGTREAHRRNLRLLDHGTLYVARFTGDSPPEEIDGSGELPSDGEFDGTGEWIPLVTGSRSHVDGMSADEVLVWTRLAADKVGPTKMDRPEDIQRNPVNGRVYMAMTNNTSRLPEEANEANPRAENKHGHIIEVMERGNDAAARRFRWRIFIVAGDPAAPDTYFAGYDKTKVSPISSPDNVTFDKAGNLWIATDGNKLGSHDGFFAVPVEGPERGHLKQFLTVARGAEACGPRITPDQRTIFVAVQHPGEVDGATPENPASHFPDGGQPRPTVMAVWRSAPGSKRIGV